GDFLFDTGAFTRLFDSIPGINVRRPERVAPMPVRGFLGTTYWQLSIAPQVALRAGGFSVLKPNLLTGSRPAFFPAHWLGIIGADYFHRHVLTIDFERRRLLVYADGAFRPDSMARLPLKTIARHNPILSKLRLGNMPPDDYLLDVGNNGQVMLQHRDEAGLRQAMGADVLVYAIQQRGLQDATG